MKYGFMLAICLCMGITCNANGTVAKAAVEREGTGIVYCGEYPQSEVSGTELTGDIIAASYDDEGVAVVNGQKYKRIIKRNVSAELYGYYLFEPIPWRVLEKNQDTMVLQSDVALDCHPFSSGIAVDWEDSVLRQWLNGEFYEQALSGIRVMDIAADGISDKVTLLSGSDLDNKEYGLSEKERRVVSASEYAEGRGAYIYSLSGGRQSSYWLRDARGDRACYVTNSGSKEEQCQTYGKNAVVPVIMLNAKELYYADANPVLCLPKHDKQKDESEWVRVIYGAYPQKEISGKSLTSSIINAAYGIKDVALVGRQKIRRVQYNGTYRYFLYEPLKWKVISYDDAQITLASDNIIDVLGGSGRDGETGGGNLDQFLDEEFLNDAFSGMERDGIQSELRILDDDMSDSKMSGFCSQGTRRLAITPYAKVLGKFSGMDFCPYWLQSVDGRRRLSGYVNKDGETIYSLFSGIKGIVPVITIKRYPYLWKVEKKVNSGEVSPGIVGTKSPANWNAGASVGGKGDEVNSTIKGDVVFFTGKKPGNIKIRNKTWDSQRITWSGVPSASNYAVYVSKSKNGMYKLLGATKSRSMTNRNLSVGKNYYYRVVGYRVVNGIVQYSKVSKAKGKKAGVPSRPTMKASKRKRGETTYVFIKWNISDARYVQLYRKRGRKYKKILDSKVKEIFKKGVTIQYSYLHGKYEFKIRTYNQAGKKRIYSRFSKKKMINV